MPYHRTLGFLQDAEQVPDKAAFEDEQGICPDDDDAKEVESGEFCRPQAVARPPRANSNGTTKKTKVGTTANTTNEVKRSNTTPDSSQGQPQPKKKKVKKAAE